MNNLQEYFLADSALMNSTFYEIIIIINEKKVVMIVLRFRTLASEVAHAGNFNVLVE
jgi:hypothetical protein